MNIDVYCLIELLTHPNRSSILISMFYQIKPIF
ncbi:hypothetical protein [Acinetobacter phage Ab69]|nr:hypothetical protein [Acinetobacter phage Ab69]